MKKKEYQDFSQLAGVGKTIMMSESSYFKKISAYLAENRLKTALEAEVKYMAAEATNEGIYAKGPGVNFKPEPPNKVSMEEKDQSLDEYMTNNLWDSRKI